MVFSAFVVVAAATQSCCKTFPSIDLRSVLEIPVNFLRKDVRAIMTTAKTLEATPLLTSRVENSAYYVSSIVRASTGEFSRGMLISFSFSRFPSPSSFLTMVRGIAIFVCACCEGLGAELAKRLTLTSAHLDNILSDDGSATMQELQRAEQQGTLFALRVLNVLVALSIVVGFCSVSLRSALHFAWL